jgi:DNA-directed RNA polymerase specialized sigma24 family protein
VPDSSPKPNPSPNRPQPTFWKPVLLAAQGGAAGALAQVRKWACPICQAAFDRHLRSTPGYSRGNLLRDVMERLLAEPPPDGRDLETWLRGVINAVASARAKPRGLKSSDDRMEATWLAARDGDAKSARLLEKKLAPICEAIAKKYGGSDPAFSGSDILQHVLKALLGPRKFDGENPIGWAITVARRHAIDMGRRRRTILREPLDKHPHSLVSKGEAAPAAVQDKEERALNCAKCLWIAQAHRWGYDDIKGALSQSQRDAYELWVGCRGTHKELGAQVGLSAGLFEARLRGVRSAVGKQVGRAAAAYTQRILGSLRCRPGPGRESRIRRTLLAAANSAPGVVSSLLRDQDLDLNAGQHDD